ncbi:MAG TPA: hypothetical protein VMN39_12330 [Longimicrobiaceae bacterium]|nr:hypothetical protein [Longimicrobiaceae bacterium]
MGVLADSLGGKTAGELIRAADWNALIDAIEGIETSLDTRISNLSNSVDERFGVVDTAISGLQDSVGTLEEQVEEMDTALQALRQRFRLVTMQTAQTDFVIGEQAEITARVTDLDGTALPLENAATRPWIDFVAAWGQLKPVPGFESRGGAGDRTISVRVNAEGIARVLLRAEHAEGFSDDAENEVSAALTTVASGAQMSLKDTILNAATPMQAVEQGAFRVMTQEYVRADAPSVRNYVDAYYIKSPAAATNKFAPNFFHRWRDYRSTVIAFVKTDSDPRTPDPNLGSCSIQVHFRDWIGPWLNLDFFVDLAPLVNNYRDIFIGNVGVDFRDTLDRFKEQVEVNLADKGILGKQKHTKAIMDAIGQMQVVNPPPFLGNVTQIVKNGLVMQQATEYGQAAAVGLGDQPITFQAFTESSARAETKAAEVELSVTGKVDAQIGKAQEQLVFQVQQEQANFRDELFAENGAIQAVQRNLQAVTGQVQGFQVALNAKADVQTLARFIPR